MSADREMVLYYVAERLDEAKEAIAAAIAACKRDAWEDPQHQLHIAAREVAQAYKEITE